MLAFLCVLVHFTIQRNRTKSMHLQYTAVADWMLVVTD